MCLAILSKIIYLDNDMATIDVDGVQSKDASPALKLAGLVRRTACFYHDE
jgi:hydrogenase maturation factor